MKRFVLALQAWYPRFELALAAVGGWMSILLMVFTVVATFARYALHRPFGAAMELTELAVPAIVFLGLAYTQRRGRHLLVDVVVERLHGRWQLCLRAMALVAGLFFFALVLWYGWEYAWRTISIGDITAHGYPTGPSKIVVPIGAFFICVRIILQLISLPKSVKG